MDNNVLAFVLNGDGVVCFLNRMSCRYC